MHEIKLYSKHMSTSKVAESLAMLDSTLKMLLGFLSLFLMARLDKGSITRRGKLEIYGRLKLERKQNRTASEAECLFIFEHVHISNF